MNEERQDKQMRVIMCACVGGAMASAGIVVNIMLRYAFRVPYASTNALIVDSFSLVCTGLIASILMLRLWRLAAWDVEHHSALIAEVRNALQIITYAAYHHHHNCGCTMHDQWYDSISNASKRISNSLRDIEPHGARVLRWKRQHRNV